MGRGERGGFSRRSPGRSSGAATARPAHSGSSESRSVPSAWYALGWIWAAMSGPMKSATEGFRPTPAFCTTCCAALCHTSAASRPPPIVGSIAPMGCESEASSTMSAGLGHAEPSTGGSARMEDRSQVAEEIPAT